MQKFSPTTGNSTGRWNIAFLILLPFLVLGSRVTSDLTASLSTLFLLYFWFKHPAHEIRAQKWFKVFLILWLYMCVTSFLMTDPQYILTQSFIAIRWPAFALVLTCLIFVSESRLKLFERSALALFVFIVIDSILQYFRGADIFGQVSNFPDRLTGPFSSPLPGSYGLRIYPMVLFCLLVFSKELPKIKVPLFIVVAALSQIFAFLTGERTVFLLFGLVNFIILIALIYQEKISFKLIAALLMTFVSLAAASIFLAPKMFARTIVSSVHQAADVHNNSYYQMYRMAISVWEKSPWFGTGTRYFNQSCEAMPIALHPQEGCEVHPHHIYLEWLTQNGIIGLGLFLVVLFFIFRILWRNLDFKNKLLESTVIFVAPVMLFFPLAPSMSMQTNNYAGLVWLLVAWAIARATIQRQSIKF